MNIRESLENHRSLTVTLSIVAIVAAVGYIVWSRMAAPNPTTFNGHVPTQAWFTTDDGNTLFADDVQKLPPFDHDGAQAVRAKVFTCDGGKHHWVQYLEKYADPGQSPAAAASQAPGNGMLLVKRPGDANWTSTANTRQVEEICIPRPPAEMAGRACHVWNPE